MAETCKKAGIETVDYTVANSGEIQTVVESMVGKVDAIYVPKMCIRDSQCSAYLWLPGKSDQPSQNERLREWQKMLPPSDSPSVLHFLPDDSIMDK